ncbi:MarR family winged helix-turn-helix transcriptional regulator [Emcibacter sp.]|uniref:MarR family winged helix-turn-helix transcriptional regulator n=1 Tax=Emcibacter sp. TaxID=1979954 RepID=UPI002AA7B274|nr:MarR family winged helix-turn-helix transcriptional regulator [Emcibacter sp.]
MNPSTEEKALIAEALETCACLGLRKASRAVTRRFDTLLDPSSLRSTQVVILLELAHNGTMTLSQLADSMVMEKSSMSRMVKTLADRGYVSVQYSGGKRYASYTLEDAGLDAIRNVVPYWMTAQKEFMDALGDNDWKEIREALLVVAKILSNKS